MKIIGHRGARGLAPENTLVSIGQAVDHHADEVEVDVRITADKIAVLHHNAYLLAGKRRVRIARTLFKELKRLKPDLATLDSALDFIDTKRPLMIEVKPGEPIMPVVSVLREHFKSGMYSPEDIFLESKSQRTLRDLHRELPDVELVIAEKWSGIRAVLRARELGATRIAMRSWWLYRGFLKAMQRHGYKLAVYTINDPVKARRWAPYIDAIFTDRPDLFERQ